MKRCLSCFCGQLDHINYHSISFELNAGWSEEPFTARTLYSSISFVWAVEFRSPVCICTPNLYIIVVGSKSMDGSFRTTFKNENQDWGDCIIRLHDHMYTSDSFSSFTAFHVVLAHTRNFWAHDTFVVNILTCGLWFNDMMNIVSLHFSNLFFGNPYIQMKI